MNNWFKDDQRVLVYPPGAGGEYIVSVLNNQPLIQDKNLNRYKCINSFPGQTLLYNLSLSKAKTETEWCEECRLDFSSEQELKKFIQKKDSWFLERYSEVSAESPQLNLPSNVQPYKWFPTHWDYKLFREPVYKWLDYTNPYWYFHWAVCIWFKDGQPGNFPGDNILFNTSKMFRKYYNDNFPNSRIDVDDLQFRADTKYLEWAQRNIDYVTNNRTVGLSKKDYEYFSELPK